MLDSCLDRDTPIMKLAHKLILCSHTRYYLSYILYDLNIVIDLNLKTIVERFFRNVPSIAGRYLLVFDVIDFVLMDLVGADQMEF